LARESATRQSLFEQLTDARQSAKLESERFHTELTQLHGRDGTHASCAEFAETLRRELGARARDLAEANARADHQAAASTQAATELRSARDELAEANADRQDLVADLSWAQEQAEHANSELESEEEAIRAYLAAESQVSATMEAAISAKVEAISQLEAQSAELFAQLLYARDELAESRLASSSGQGLVPSAFATSFLQASPSPDSAPTFGASTAGGTTLSSSLPPGLAATTTVDEIPAKHRKDLPKLTPPRNSNPAEAGAEARLWLRSMSLRNMSLALRTWGEKAHSFWTQAVE
jgi:hypothetical protein